MKKNYLFAALIAASAMFASCTNEEMNNDLDAINGDVARITIDLSNPATRAFTGVDTDAEDADNVINNLIVFVTRTDGVQFDVAPIYVSAADITANVFEVTATTKADKVYIVTNTGPIAGGPFASVNDMNAVKAAAAKGDGTTGNGSKVAPGNVWMSGESTTLANGTADPGADNTPGTADDIAVKEATIQLYYIPAKVYVEVTNSMTNYVGGNTVIKGVTLTNAGAWTGFINSNANTTFSTTNRPDYRAPRTATWAQAPYYFNGVAIEDAVLATNYADVPAQVGAPLANDFAVNAAFSNITGINDIQTAGGTSTGATLTTADAFYVFPAQIGDTEKVWAAVYGTFDADGTGAGVAEQRFWTMAFGGADNIASELKSGNKYMVTLELAGDGKIDGGEKDPTIETTDAILKVKVDPAEWNVSNPHKVFN